MARTSNISDLMTLPEELHDLYMNDPVVHSCVDLSLRDNLTFEEMMIMIVTHLAHEKNQYKNRVFEMLSGRR